MEITGSSGTPTSHKPVIDAGPIKRRRTTTDFVFDHLHEEIASMRLLPGAKLSEVEIARRFGVSRQPVRDAFSRLSNLGLLLVRPQRATQVKGFSLDSIRETRFIRAAVELEVIRRACATWNDDCDRRLRENIEKQRTAIAQDSDDFHLLDSEFHALICQLGHCPEAIDVIAQCRKKMERLCALSMERDSEADVLLKDHEQLADALKSQATEQAIAVARRHFDRLDQTIADIHKNHIQYFE